eukprot:scaffold527_cov368-Prasinococcus_capsulatus_cf.AAC.40
MYPLVLCLVEQAAARHRRCQHPAFNQRARSTPPQASILDGSVGVRSRSPAPRHAPPLRRRVAPRGAASRRAALRRAPRLSRGGAPPRPPSSSTPPLQLLLLRRVLCRAALAAGGSSSSGSSSSAVQCRHSTPLRPPRRGLKRRPPRGGAQEGRARPAPPKATFQGGSRPPPLEARRSRSTCTSEDPTQDCVPPPPAAHPMQGSEGEPDGRWCDSDESKTISDVQVGSQ